MNNFFLFQLQDAVMRRMSDTDTHKAEMCPVNPCDIFIGSMPKLEAVGGINRSCIYGTVHVAHDISVLNVIQQAVDEDLTSFL
jgi:hypothetical protein